MNNSAPILVTFAQNDRIERLTLFEVKWVEAIYSQPQTEDESYVVYRVMLDDDFTIDIPNETIGQAYYRLEQPGGTHNHDASERIGDLALICQFQREGKPLQHAAFWTYARWIHQKLGIQIRVPRHTQTQVL
jgi:hypothetical protein